jgi:hypothetical protein
MLTKRGGKIMPLKACDGFLLRFLLLGVMVQPKHVATVGVQDVLHRVSARVLRRVWSHCCFLTHCPPETYGDPDRPRTF